MNYQTLENVIDSFDANRNKISDFTYEELCKMNFHGNATEIQDMLYGDKILEFEEYGPRILKYYEAIKDRKTKITTLEDVLSLDRQGKRLFIEIKTNYSKEQKEESRNYARSLLELCNKHQDQNITFIGRDTNTLMAIKEENSLYQCLPVIGYNDVEKALYGLDGVSSAFNHLDKKIPNTEKRLFEYFAERGEPIAVWVVDSFKKYHDLDQLLNEVENVYPTSNYADLLHEYDDGVRKFGK